jgi:hypothetical protein
VAPHIGSVCSAVATKLAKRMKFWYRAQTADRAKYVKLKQVIHWALTVREKPRLKVLEKRVLRGVFGSKGDEVTVEWR